MWLAGNLRQKTRSCPVSSHANVFFEASICRLVTRFTTGTQNYRQSDWSFLFLPSLFWGCIHFFPETNWWFLSFYLKAYGCFLYGWCSPATWTVKVLGWKSNLELVKLSRTVFGFLSQWLNKLCHFIWDASQTSWTISWLVKTSNKLVSLTTRLVVYPNLQPITSPSYFTATAVHDGRPHHWVTPLLGKCGQIGLSRHNIAFTAPFPVLSTPIG